VSTGDRVPGPAQVFRQIHFHLGRRLERHRVQVRVKLRQEANAVALYQRGVLDPGLVIGEAFLRGQSGHPDVHAQFLRITLLVIGTDFSEFAHCGIEQDDLDDVVVD